MKYARSDGDKASFLAIPAVLKRGVQIGHHAQHKGGKVNASQNVESWTFAAPVTINGITGNMAVIVQKTTGLFYKAHKVLMPDGRAFLLSENNNTESGRVQGATTSGRHAGPTDSVSIHSIHDSTENSNNNIAEADTERYSADDSEFEEAMPEDRELLLNAAARDGAHPEVTAWGKKQARIETLERKAANLREAMENADEEERAEMQPILDKAEGQLRRAQEHTTILTFWRTIKRRSAALFRERKAPELTVTPKLIIAQIVYSIPPKKATGIFFQKMSRILGNLSKTPPRLSKTPRILSSSSPPTTASLMKPCRKTGSCC